MSRKLVIVGVFGGDEQRDIAESVGREIVVSEQVLLTGGQPKPGLQSPNSITCLLPNSLWKLKAIQAFRFPRKRRVFLDHHMKHGGAVYLLVYM